MKSVVANCPRHPCCTSRGDTSSPPSPSSSNWYKKTKHQYIRAYDKYEPVDILPITNFCQSEVYQLCDAISELVTYRKYSTALDLITYEELEWLDQVNEADKKRYNYSILDCDDPAKHPVWYKFTSHQKELIAKVHQIAKLTQYKENPNIPIFI